MSNEFKNHLKEVESRVFLGTPPNSMSMIPRFTSSCPWMVGNRLWMRFWYKFLSTDILYTASHSSLVMLFLRSSTVSI